MPRIPLLRFAAFCFLFVVCRCETQAALIIYDPFNQAVGPMNGTASSGGSPAAVWPTGGQNWNTPTATSQIVSGSLSGSVLTQGNRAQLGPENASIFRDFGITLGGAGTDLWLSFLITGQSAKNSQVISLFNGATEQLAIGVNGSTVYGLSVRTNGATTSAGNPAVSTTIAPNNLTHFVAVHLELIAGTGNSIFTVYVDPDPASFGGAGPTGGQSGFYTGNGAQPFSFNRIRLGEFSAATTSFDEFRVGDTWADVTPVPEPSSAALLLLGCLGLAGRRRRVNAPCIPTVS